MGRFSGQPCLGIIRCYQEFGGHFYRDRKNVIMKVVIHPVLRVLVMCRYFLVYNISLFVMSIYVLVY